jgi:hypothetical protein
MCDLLYGRGTVFGHYYALRILHPIPLYRPLELKENVYVCGWVIFFIFWNGWVGDNTIEFLLG